MRRTAIIITILILATPITALGQGNEARIDCSYYYTMAYNTIHLYLENQSKALEMAKTLANKTLPGKLGQYHTKYYNDIIELITTINSYRENTTRPQRALDKLTQIYQGLPRDYMKYSYSLMTCVHDPQIAATMGAKTRILLKSQVLPRIANIIREIVYSRVSMEVKIIPGKNTYKPGDEATILLVSKDPVRLERVELVEWPTLRLLEDYQPGENESLVNRTVKLRIPYAYELSYPMAINEFARKEVVSFAVIASYWNTRSEAHEYSVRIINATYKVPRISIIAPTSIAPGEPLRFAIDSDGYYPNTTVMIDGTPVRVVNLTRGINNITIPLDKLNVTKLIVLLQVRVPPGQDNVGISRDKPILYTYGKLPFGVESPKIIFTWLGEVTLKTYRNAPATLYARLGPITVHSGPLPNTTVSFFASVLPVTPLNIVVVSQDTGKRIVFSKTIIVVNPTYISVLSILILAFIYPESIERLSIISLTRRGGQVRAPSLAAHAIYRIRSKLAQLYYKTLILLRVRLPFPHETLREHFRQAPIPERVGRHLWKLLRLAERDLYSRRKPSYKEAEEAFKEVIRNARKK